MDGPVRLTMPDGTVIWARVDGAAGAQPADGAQGAESAAAAKRPELDGFAPAPSPESRPAPGGAADVSFPHFGRSAAEDQPSHVANFVETIRSVAATVHDAVAARAPSAVCVEFGLELSIQTGQFVAVLAQAGAKTSIKVRLDWDRAALSEAQAQAEASAVGGEAEAVAAEAEAAQAVAGGSAAADALSALVPHPAAGE